MAVSGTSSSGNLSGLASPGVGSGLDVNSIVTKLMAVEQRPLTLLNQREAGFQAKLSAYGSLKGALAAFQGTMQTLATASRFQANTAVSSDTAVLTASASSDAVPGSYAISIDHIAQAQVLAAAGVADANTASSTGTLTIQVGSGSARVITVDTTNNSLNGLRDAINAAGAGVSATIVNDGGATPYKLVLTASASGAANTISITNSLAAGELRDAVTSLAEVRGALDAALTINGVAVASASNTLTTAVPGATLNLVKAGSSTLTVARDTAGIQSAVTQFVKSYNDLNGTLASLTGYNAASKQGGLLLGDSAAQKLQSDLRALVAGAVGNTGGSLTTLSQIGIAFQKDGALALDSAKLTAAIGSNFSDLASLFAVRGRSSSALLTFGGSATATQTGTYQVTIAAAATRGAATAANAAAGTTTIDGTNDGFAVTIDGVASGPLTLAHGSNQTPAQLAQALQSAINGASAFSSAGIAATVSVESGRLVVSSNRYGTDSQVSGATGTAIAALGFNGSETGTGTNVSGSFSLNGSIIAATGSGQTLSAPAGSAAAGLQLKYTGTPAQALATPVLTLNLSEGIASRLQHMAADRLDSEGVFATRTEGINTSIREIEARREALARRLTQVEANYRSQFNALDTLISNLNQTSSFLTQQLASLQNLNK
jgi:flagellar hook-associated protein 2